MAKYFLIGEVGDGGAWLVDVEDKSVRRIEETELAGDFGQARTDDALVRGVNLAVVSESRTGPSAHNRLQVAY